MLLEQFSFLLVWLVVYENIDAAQHNLEHLSLSGFQFANAREKKGKEREREKQRAKEQEYENYKQKKNNLQVFKCSSTL